jgi:Immunity protein 53
MNNLKPLEIIDAWFKMLVNGDWEHHNGIKIETTDNPGWMITLNLPLDLQKRSDEINYSINQSDEVEGMIKNGNLYLYSVDLSVLVNEFANILNFPKQ